MTKIGSNKPRRWRVENAFVPYLLMVALRNIPQDGQGLEVSKEWLDFLERDSVRPLENLKKSDVSSYAREISNLTTVTFKAASAITTYKELALAICFMITKFVKDNRLDDIEHQGVLIANALLLEHAEDQTWGNSKLAKKAAEQMENFLRAEGYFSCKILTIH